MEFEFADAEVAACTLEGTELTVRFAAARAQAHPRAEAQWMPLTLIASGVQVTTPADVPASLGRLHDGLVVWVTGGRRQRGLAIPFDSAAPVVEGGTPAPADTQGGCTLELECAQGQRSRWAVVRLQVLAPVSHCAVGAYQC